MRTRGLLETLAVGAGLSFCLTLSGCHFFNRDAAPKIPFAPTGEDYHKKMDLAQIEYKYPLAPADLQKITPDNINKLSQEELDQIYARLTAGPIPDGAFNGRILLPRGSSGKFRLAEIAGAHDGRSNKPPPATLVEKVADVARDPVGFALHLKGLQIQFVGEHLWQGKVFYRDERVLRNRIDDLSLLRKAGLVQDEPKKITFGGKDAWLLFPAKLYCGQSLFDSRRESVIIDYFFTDEIPGYMEYPDFLAGRRGVRVRDEIRMIRPGFYLGRAYLDRIFGLNFTLYNPEIAGKDGDAFVKTGQVTEDCWPGTQPRVVVSK